MSKLKEWIKLSDDGIKPSQYGQIVSGTGMPTNNITDIKRWSSFGGEFWEGRVGFSNIKPLPAKKGQEGHTCPICKGEDDKGDER